MGDRRQNPIVSVEEVSSFELPLMKRLFESGEAG
jgi:hypothetical protein